MSRDTLDAGMRQHFALFLMRVYGELHPGKPPLRLAWYVLAICHALVRAALTPGSRLAVSVPPRHLKSIAASVALTAWLLGRNPSLRIMVATYSQDLARLHATQCRMIMQTEWYRRMFPDTRIADDGNRILEIVTTSGGGRKAVSVGGTVTGFGADIIIVDDCLKAEDARSEAARAEVKAWFDGTLATRLNSPGGGAIISIAQRLREDDLPAYLIEKDYEHLCLPAIAERDEKIAIGPDSWYERQVGGVLDEQRQTRAELEQVRRTLGPQVFSAQYQQNPIAPEGNLVRMEWFPTYDEQVERDCYQAVVQSWDTASSDTSMADYSACLTLGYREGRWRLLDAFRGRLDFPDLKRAVLRQKRLWRPDEVLVEDANSGKSLWQEFRASGELRPIMCTPEGSKESRLVGITGQLEAGMCALPTEAPWLDEFRAELRGFPFARNDDQVDALSQFFIYYLLRGQWLLEERDKETGRILRIKRRDRIQRR